MSESATSTAVSIALADEIPVELPPEVDAPKAAVPAEPVKTAVSPLAAPHDAAPTPANDDPAATRATVAADDDIDTGGTTGADNEVSEAGAGGTTGADNEVSEAGAASDGLAALEPSGPHDRLLFDPFRATRDRRASGGIRLLIDSSRLRGHSLGAGVGGLLARFDSSSLLGPASIDPIRDTQRIFIYAPKLGDSSGLVMMLQHRIPSARLRARLAELGDRFLTPTPGLLIAAPESIAKSADSLASLIALPTISGPSVVWAHIETPSHAFAGMPVSIPRSLRWIEVRIALDGDGMVARFEAEDEDERSAPLTARHLAAALSSALGLVAATEATRARSPEEGPTIDFHASGPLIIGTCRLTPGELATLIERLNANAVLARQSEP